VGTYLALAVMDQLDAAQAELERHVVTGLDGRCAGCRELEPCPERGRLEAVFARYGRLPVRRPGVTGVGVRSVESPRARSWFASTNVTEAKFNR
jgi:hypothetical protein